MARATTTRTAARTPRTKAVADAPKRKPGRPLGSTNARSAGAKSAKTVSKRQAAPKVVARAPKMSKADLETYVAKLERSIARLREKNKELKHVAVEAQDRADMIEAQQAAAPAAGTTKSGRKAGRSATRAAAKPSATEQHEESDESSEG